MAVYWVDPFIDAPIGGLDGTLDTTTRDGSYSYPLGLTDVYNSSAELTVVGGIALYDGDELRFKGQAVSNYLLNIGTPGNVVPMKSGSISYYAYFDSTSYQSAVNTAWSTYQGQSWTTMPMIFFDQSLQGNETFILSQTSTSPVNTGYIRFYNSYSSTGIAWLGAKQGIDETDGTTFGFIDPNYVFDWNADLSTYSYFLSIRRNITITDGWDSETTQNGVTILSGARSLTSTSYTRLFDYAGLLSDARPVYNMPNTYWFMFNQTNYYIYPRVYNYWSYFDSGQLKFGGIFGNTYNAYAYIYTSGIQKTSSEPSVEIGTLGLGRYVWVSGNGNSVNNGLVRLNNMVMGQSLRNENAYVDLEIGHCFVDQPYSGGSLLYVNGASSDVTILAGSHLHGDSLITTTNTSSTLTTVTYEAGVTTPTVNPPSAYPSSGGSGPVAGSIITSSHAGYQDNTVQATLAGSTIDTVYGIGPSNRTENLGTLDCQGSDYKATNANIILQPTLATNQDHYTAFNYHFATNNYDGKPLAIWTPLNASTAAYTPCLLSYNDNDGNIIVMGSNKTTLNRTYIKSFVVEMPSLVGKTTLSVSIPVERSNATTLSIDPNIRIWLPRSDSTSYATNLISPMGSGDLTGNATGTFNISSLNLDTDSKFFGIRVDCYFPAGADYTNTFTFGDPVVTVT